MHYIEDTTERHASQFWDAEQFWDAIDACATLADLEQRFGDDLIWLESESDRRIERWGFVSVSGELHVCAKCHALYPSDADLSDGCETCGHGMPEFD